MHFTWYGVKPVLPPLLEGLPIIKFEELASDPREIKLDLGNRAILQSGSALHQVNGPYDREDLRSFGTLGFSLTVEDDTSRKHLVATVGHVLGDNRTQVIIHTTDNSQSVYSTTMKGCESFLG